MNNNESAALDDSNGATLQPDGSVLADILSVARNLGDEEALRSGSASLTYGELVEVAAANAERIRNAGVRPGDFVLCAIRSGVSLPLAWVATMLTGAVIVPVDTNWPQARCKHVQHATGARVVLVCADQRPLHFAGLAFVQIEPFLKPVKFGDPRSTTAGSMLYGFFTSGSTGTPKCALNYDAGVANRLRYMTKRFGSTHVVYQNSSPLFDSSIWQMMWPLSCGGVAVIPESRSSWDLEQLVSDVRDHRVTMTDFVPTLFAQLVKALIGGRIEPRSLATLRHILIGGEQIDARAVQEFRRMIPACEVVNTYGHTEASIGMVFHTVRDEDGLNIPLGTPIDNTYVKVTDADLRVVPDGEIGEIIVGGVCVGAGYLGRPDLTQKAFLPNSFADVPGNRVYRSGDFGRRRADGLLEYCGRADDQVKLNGVRIELIEIEDAVKELFPAMGGARALIVEREGHGKVLALAYGAEEPLDHGVMRSVLAIHLPSSHVPRLFLHTPSLPMTENGKIDRQALLAEISKTSTQCPNSTADLPASILGAFRASLGGRPLTAQDDFFEAGGDSLAAVELALRLEQLLSRPVLSGDIYRYPTAATFARLCTDEAVSKTDDHALSVPAIRGEFSRPCSPVRTVLLTGATGFVGVHVLDALLARKEIDLQVVVRAPDTWTARTRVERAYRQAFGVLPDLARVRAVSGELCQPRFGLNDKAWAELATSVDEVVHCAAEVNFMAPASRLYAPNVLGTAEAIHLCGAGKPKRLHMISSLAVRDLDTDEHPGKFQRHGGYAVTKWLAEQAVVRASDAGLHASVYRIDDVLPSTATGFGNPRSLAHLLLRRCVDLGVAPRGVGMLSLLAADSLASWLASFIGQPEQKKWSLYEVTGNSYADFGELVSGCGQPNRSVHLISGKEFVQMLESAGHKEDLLLAHLLRERLDSVLFTRSDRLVSTEELPMRELLKFDYTSVQKFVALSRANAGTQNMEVV